MLLYATVVVHLMRLLEVETTPDIPSPSCCISEVRKVDSCFEVSEVIEERATPDSEFRHVAKDSAAFGTVYPVEFYVQKATARLECQTQRQRTRR